jgi:transcriptional regulator of arginine metabolism
MLMDRDQIERRNAILRLLRAGNVARQADLVGLLRKEGHDVTQSSISRDLRDLGIFKAAGRYVVPPDDQLRPNGDFGALGRFVREVRAAGPTIAVVKTAVGAAQSVAVAVDRAEWPEVVGTISGDDTIFIATSGARAQSKLLARLRTLFPV